MVLAREIQYYQRIAAETGVPIELLTQTLPNASMMLAQMQQAQMATSQGKKAPVIQFRPESAKTG
jgi:hypothetical protein